MSDYEVLLKRLEDLLSQTDKVLDGTVVKLGKTVQVNVGQGRYVQAENLGVQTPGKVGVVFSQGKYYIYPIAASELIQRKVLYSRRSKQLALPNEIYPFKILFSVVEDGVRKFYVGGFGHTAIFVAEGDFIAEPRLEILGSKPKDWSVNFLKENQYFIIFGNPLLNRSYIIPTAKPDPQAA